MNLKQLEAFVAIADEGSFSRAAKTLFLTQPTVSAHISSLEQELNVRLFVRNTKEVSLSEDGKILYSYAKQMISLEKQIEMTFDKTRKEGSHCIRIAASSVPAQYLVPQILERFSKKYPQEQFKLMETDSGKVVEQVVNYNVDIGFTGTVFEKKYCEYMPFYKDELVVITPNSEKFRKLIEEENAQPEGSNKNWMWIQNEPVILREEGSGTRKEAERLLKGMGINMDKLNIVASMENSETIKRSVSRGIGISILSRLAAEEELREGKILGFSFGGSNKGSRNINIVYNKNFQMSDLTEKFLKVVKGE
ncbi:selenium metabolism-associated LysR family transcriptional regulator [Clostridium sp. C105KSO13]|uniref:selenium metabolism-associated LysR family transcriptional regulator n=1 Tax=Clostridium sp. C105KSO13 TaxID=1776045 RepID=UPI0007407BA0|nr:selenium metabolism-associated LysR family transcriptional regulator [Clostridium sp. C105KSO13]CUX16694.1 HTH-type transcriptional regulator CysL [Clostridium sp. C105KSO13]